MVASGFLADTTALTALSTDLDGDAARLTTLRGDVTTTPPTGTAFGLLPQSTEVSKALASCLGCVGQDLDSAAETTGRIATGVSKGAAGYQTADSQVATEYERLGAEADQTQPTPVASGGATTTSNEPFGDAIRNNRALITEELAAERRRLAEHQAIDRANESNNGWLGWRSWDDNDKDDDIANSQARITTYESILANNRKILQFDPAGDGAMVELVGDINADTRNVAVYVPGTTAELADFERYYQGAKTFTDADPTNGLATVVWMGGDFPDKLTNAVSASYAQDLAPQLNDFSHQLRSEIANSAAGGNDVQVTVAGHSYGGAVVGTAEQLGLDADRVLHIASAGMGHDVQTPADLHPTQPDVERYSITAPGDPIRWIRDTNIGNWGHGADPEAFPGVVQLETGYYADGRPLEGAAAHVDVISYHSDAWWNIYNVFTGGPVVPDQPNVP